MSMLPGQFSLVLTVFMVMGAWRIPRVRVLTRRVAAIETLGPQASRPSGAERTDRICLALAEQLEEVAGPVAEMSGF